VLYDAVIVPAGKLGTEELAKFGQTSEFLKEQYRHCKPILALGDAMALLQKAEIPAALPSGEEDPGLIVCRGGIEKDTAARFSKAISKHRHFERALDPPPV
jgi:catalase